MKKAVAMFLLSFCLITATQAAGLAAERQFKVVAVEISGTKFWLPSTLIVKKGETVKIHLDNKIPGPNNVHGFAIDDFKIAELVDSKGKDVQFVADKAGVFPIRCQLHPAHVGGQLEVQE